LADTLPEKEATARGSPEQTETLSERRTFPESEIFSPLYGAHDESTSSAAAETHKTAARNLRKKIRPETV